MKQDLKEMQDSHDDIAGKKFNYLAAQSDRRSYIFCCLIYIPQIIWIQSADAVGKQMETGENYLCDDIKGHWNATPNSVVKF